jgi:GTP-binding protein
MATQTKTAIASADAVMFLMDARTGVMPSDRAIAQLVRKSGKPAILVANKCEGRAAQSGVHEAYTLGLGEPIALSAEHGEGLSDLYDALRVALPDQTEPADDEADEAQDAEAARPIRVAIVGRPNAGKSTLVNRLVGEERMLTGPEAGITRDTIAVELEWYGRHFLLHDTAGLRRPARVEETLEKLSTSDAIEAIRFAEVVVVLMDAAGAFEDQDLRIADLVGREGRALVIAISKWDLKEHDGGAIGKMRDEADRRLQQVRGVPVVAVSGLTGEGLDRMMKAVVEIHAVWNKRVPTHALNRWLEEAIAAHPPPAVSGRRLKLNYMTQAKARPPSFVLFCTRADAVPDDYKRYLINGLRETFELPGVPIRLMLREKENPFAGKSRNRNKTAKSKKK